MYFVYLHTAHVRFVAANVPPYSHGDDVHVLCRLCVSCLTHVDTTAYACDGTIFFMVMYIHVPGRLPMVSLLRQPGLQTSSSMPLLTPTPTCFGHGHVAHVHAFPALVSYTHSSDNVHDSMHETDYQCDSVLSLRFRVDTNQTRPRHHFSTQLYCTITHLHTRQHEWTCMMPASFQLENMTLLMTDKNAFFMVTYWSVFADILLLCERTAPGLQE